MGVFSCIGGDLLDGENQLSLHKPKIRFFLSEGVEFHSNNGDRVCSNFVNIGHDGVVAEVTKRLTSSWGWCVCL